jgi:hypothetical protein
VNHKTMKLVFVEYTGPDSLVKTTVESNTITCTRMATYLAKIATQHLHNFEVNFRDRGGTWFE